MNNTMSISEGTLRDTFRDVPDLNGGTFLLSLSERQELSCQCPEISQQNSCFPSGNKNSWWLSFKLLAEVSQNLAFVSWEMPYVSIKFDSNIPMD